METTREWTVTKWCDTNSDGSTFSFQFIPFLLLSRRWRCLRWNKEAKLYQNNNQQQRGSFALKEEPERFRLLPLSMKHYPGLRDLECIPPGWGHSAMEPQPCGEAGRIEKTSKRKERAVQRWGGKGFLDFHRGRFCMERCGRKNKEISSVSSGKIVTLVDAGAWIMGIAVVEVCSCSTGTQEIRKGGVAQLRLQSRCCRGKGGGDGGRRKWFGIWKLFSKAPAQITCPKKLIPLHLSY